MLKLSVGPAIPLMNLLMRVLAMLMRVADMEGIGTLQVVMNNVVVEKKKQEKGMKAQSPIVFKCENPPMVKSKTKNSSLGSFSVVSEGSHHTYASHQSQDQVFQAAASSSRSVLAKNRKCYCGLKPIKPLSQTRTQLPEAVLPLSQGTSEPGTMPLLSVAAGDKRGGVRADVCQESKGQPSAAKTHAASKSRPQPAHLIIELEAVPSTRSILSLLTCIASTSGIIAGRMPTSR